MKISIEIFSHNKRGVTAYNDKTRNAWVDIDQRFSNIMGLAPQGGRDAMLEGTYDAGEPAYIYNIY